MDMDVVSPPRRNSAAPCRGLSYIELLAATAITAILMAVAAPSFSEMLQNHRLTAHLNQLISHIHYARSLAVKSNNNAIVCTSPNGMSCSNSSAWNEGWILFIDTDGRSLGNGNFTFCDQRGAADAKSLVLYRSGRIRNGQRMPDGSELSCPTG